MITPLNTLRRCDGAIRRDVLRLGCLTVLGLTAGSWSRLHADAPAARPGLARACILVWLDGGASHLESFDPKPDAPGGGAVRSGPSPLRWQG